MLAVVAATLDCGRFGYDPFQRDPGEGLAAPSDGGSSSPEPTTACRNGFADCDGNSGNGCETDTSASTSTCGGCSARCDNAHGTTRCASGLCDPSCETGFADCDGNPTNGCEANLNSDPNRCGGCTNVCGSGLVCSAGGCIVSSCPVGMGDCDDDPDVCEVSHAASLEHCGFCNNACTATNGTPACVAGECRVQGCGGGFDDCDGVPSNGCEAALATTTEHCGSCGTACTNAHGTTRCTGASCAPACSTGYDDCDGSPQNGCETPLDSVAHCGACGNTCPANGGTPVCNAGVCETRCDLNGTFALKLTAPCSWPSSQYRRAGSGTLVYWMKADWVQAGTSLATTLTECGRVKPPLVNTANETVQQGFPNSLYDNDYLPSTSTAVTLSATSPGATLSWPLTALLMGISMANPETDPWPSAASQVPAARRIDMDRDGKAGMTGSYAGGDYPRTSTSVVFNRADLFYFAARTTFSLGGALTSCSAASGSATLSGADIRILGCNRANSTQDCTTSESDLLDTTAAPLTIGAGSYTLTRVANGASCATVRAAAP